MFIKGKEKEKEYVENDGVMLALCSGYPLIGKSVTTNGKVEAGLGIIDITTESSDKEKRISGNVVLECDGISHRVIGFENHGGKTDIKGYTPFGKVLKGKGNDGVSGLEGVIYKNLFATYLHGPLFPKNPELCDMILEKALRRKYPDFDKLEKIDDVLEIKANEFMEKRI